MNEVPLEVRRIEVFRIALHICACQEKFESRSSGLDGAGFIKLADKRISFLLPAAGDDSS